MKTTFQKVFKETQIVGIKAKSSTTYFPSMQKCSIGEFVSLINTKDLVSQHAVLSHKHINMNANKGRYQITETRIMNSCMRIRQVGKSTLPNL